jgi:isopentenyl-diphosphate delta-isomerase type 1
MTGDELLDVVDERDCVIGTASRREIHARALRHRAVHIFVLNPAGELFVQKRADGKDTFPGCYDSSASGHLDSGESYDAAAVRELREELGLTVPAGHLRKHFQIAACAETGWEFVWVYSAVGDYRPAINPAELQAGEFWPLAQIKQRIATDSGQFAPSFRLVFQEFCRHCKPSGFRL